MSVRDHSLEHNNRGHVCDWTLNYFKTTHGSKTFLDIGAGIGLNCVWAEKYHGYTSTGIEADGACEKIHNNIVIHDFVSNGVCEFDETFDLGWSVATSEHIDEVAADDYVKTFLACKTVVFTWCPPGYSGYHHVNCQPQSYWINKFQKHGFVFDQSLSTLVAVNCKLRMVKSLDKQRKSVPKGYLRDWATVFHNPSIKQ